MKPPEPTSRRAQLQELYEVLSRRASGELTAPELAALEERLASDPHAASAADAFERMISGLVSLPESPPPEALDDLVLGRASPARRSPRSYLAASVGLGLVAASLVGFWGGARLWERPTTIVLARGEQIVEGRADLFAGDASITLDGRARISVEPIPPPVRAPVPESAEMKIAMGSLGGAVVGAIITVAVLDGEAVVTTSDGETIGVGAGETKVIAPSEPAIPTRIAENAPAGERIAALQAEVESLRQKLAEAEFTSAVVRGQIAHEQGEPYPWPSNVDAAYLPEAFEENLRAEIAKIPGLSLHQLDCEEFPCVATLLGTDPNGELEAKLKALPETLTTNQYPDAGVWMGLAKMESDKGVRSAAGLALMPAGTKSDDNLRTRTDFRAGNLMRELESSLEDEHAP